MTTQSEQYDQKLRAELYEAMVRLRDETIDTDTSSDLHRAADWAVYTYFKCIAGGDHV